MFGSEVLIEKGRGLDAFGEEARLLMAAEARRKIDPIARTIAYVADLASLYDVLSDRLGATMSWPAPKVCAILKPLFEQAEYTDARRMFSEFERQLDQPIR